MVPELNEEDPELGSCIYFHETSCPKDMSDVSLNPRQACSVESALRAHPNTDVYLLISSPIFVPLSETKNRLVQELLTFPNFKLRHINFSRYLSKTPLEKIHLTGALNGSKWPVSHSSDVLRYATLYKFGGIYLDLDVIVLKPLIKLRNFAGAESNTSVGSGILGFAYDNIGREFAKECANELASTYDGKIWGFNGPGVITRVLGRKCQTTNVSQMVGRYCRGFHVYPTSYFAAFSYNEPEFFFHEGNTKKAREILNKSYAIHYWNKLSSKFVLNKTADIPFLKYAQNYCPRVYEVADGNF
ncbi:hypothetical protein RUM43_004690 [Polyplax serrata]|uniref:Alpha 1,4-glycosyltransferase domain-containing protein n=1 Tax=Polyplax serrata TaxID=468196 RepID=A0AAN8SB85_POLSC